MAAEATIPAAAVETITPAAEATILAAEATIPAVEAIILAADAIIPAAETGAHTAAALKTDITKASETAVMHAETMGLCPAFQVADANHAKLLKIMDVAAANLQW